MFKIGEKVIVKLIEMFIFLDIGCDERDIRLIKNMHLHHVEKADRNKHVQNW